MAGAIIRSCGARFAGGGEEEGGIGSIPPVHRVSLSLSLEPVCRLALLKQVITILL